MKLHMLCILVLVLNGCLFSCDSTTTSHNKGLTQLEREQIFCEFISQVAKSELYTSFINGAYEALSTNEIVDIDSLHKDSHRLKVLFIQGEENIILQPSRLKFMEKIKTVNGEAQRNDEIVLDSMFLPSRGEEFCSYKISSSNSSIQPMLIIHEEFLDKHFHAELKIYYPEYMLYPKSFDAWLKDNSEQTVIEYTSKYDIKSDGIDLEINASEVIYN